MGTGHQGRSLTSLRLTKAFHFRYLGLWAIMNVGLVIALNVVLYLFLEEHLAGINSMFTEMHAEYMQYRDILITALCVEAILFSAGIVALASVTSHRIAGPYIRLEHTFQEVKSGKPSVRLNFRSYDHLEGLEKSFNEMMETIEERTVENIANK